LPPNAFSFPASPIYGETNFFSDDHATERQANQKPKSKFEMKHLDSAFFNHPLSTHQPSTQPMTETTIYPQISVLNPPPSSRRNGKIARLPKETRDMLNRMLDDGIPYHVIIDELGEAGDGLNTQNLTNWKQGGYQEWVKNQELIEQTRVQTETAIDLLRATDGAANAAKVVEACHMVGATQLLHALLDHGDEAVKKLLVNNPDTYIRILNIVCRLSDSGLRYEDYDRLLKESKAHQAQSR
jgi:hypothetical protein